VNGTSPRRALAGLVGGDFSDPTNERIIYLSAAGLVIVGLLLLLGTIVWWRRGRQEHPALAPLEVMGRRAWEKAPEGDRRRRLDHVRLAGAGATEKARAEPLDLQALVRSTPQAFDDLREPGEVPEVESVGAVEAAVGDPVAAVEETPSVEAVAADPVKVEPVKVDPVKVEAVQAADVAAPSKESTVAAPAPAPAVVDPDATSISTERPPQAVDALASGPSDPLL
jgi:hypothetical protein